MTKTNKLDKFYTQDKVAKYCVSIVERLYGLDYLMIEPSAGDGVFLKYLNNYIAYDIDPKNDNIIKLDYLKENLNLLNKEKNIVIGNPPFGKKAKLAIDFINKSFNYSNIVAFILPIQFLKYSAQKNINKNAKLIFSELLDPNSFRVNDKEYSVRCCFQIWTLNNDSNINLRIINPPQINHPDFEMWQYNNTETASKYFNKELYQWDFAVPRQGYKDYTVKETNPDNMDRKTQWIFFKANNDIILERLKKIDFDKLSKNNTSTPGFGKADVVKEYMSLYENNS